jgi:hypothetical protein
MIKFNFISCVGIYSKKYIKVFIYKLFTCALWLDGQFLMHKIMSFHQNLTLKIIKNSWFVPLAWP